MNGKASLLESIRHALAASGRAGAVLQWVRDLPGGDINRAALIGNGDEKWFLKYRANAPEGMFAAEARALAEISRQGCIRAPAPLVHGSDGGTSWLLLEYLELTSLGDEALLGQRLAQLHSVTGESFGWMENNYIGTTPQDNTPGEDWALFWRDRRLRPQIEMARAAGFGGNFHEKSERLLEATVELIGDHRPAASLLHGDLWAGNKAYTPAGDAVIFDPASYYGDRETDIAMSALFGGFGQSFYDAYQARLPLPEGHRHRRDLYNLYHLLNHLNLFGGGYLSRCSQAIDGLLAQLR